MDQHQEITTPVALQGLGLSLDQLCQVNDYFGHRIAISKRQRAALIAVTMIIFSGIIVGWMYADPKDLPFDSLMMVLLSWVAIIGIAVSALTLVLQWYQIVLLNKEVSRLGLSERAREQIITLGLMVTLMCIFGSIFKLILNTLAYLQEGAHR